LQSGMEYSILNYFLIEKAWTRSMVRGPRAALVHGGPWTGPWRRLTEAQLSGRSGPWWLAARVATRRGQCSATGEPLTGAWTTMRRRHDGGGASAQKGDGVGMAERRRGQADGVGVFHQGGGVLL
jgi:hypothetical protein